MTAEPTKIVVIDDEKVILLGIGTILKNAGYQVATALNGAEGLKLIRANPPDLIICDVTMPPPDGFELKEILSKDPKISNIPFVFVTARTAQTDKVAGLESGADDYITKPFDRAELLARVQAVLRRDNKSRKRGRQEAEVEIEKLRREILNNITHELRTPVGILLNTLELTLNNRFENPDEEKEFIGRALTNVHQLRGLIEDLLFLTYIDQGTLNTFRQAVDFQFDLFDPAQYLLERYEDKKIKLNINVDPQVSLNAPRHEFKQISMHLIDNACKFSPEKGVVEVEVKPNGVGGGIMIVKDQGPGVSPALREKIFERYYQVSQGDSRLFRGLGLGLTIARAVTRALGGDVVILDSETGCWVQMIIPPASQDWKA
jgi:two-component system, sensor histidine kinase and response regulator